MGYLDEVPFLFLVLWDHNSTTPELRTERCRIWVVRPRHDVHFRRVCSNWYEQRDSGRIKSNNFQLHPPRGKDENLIKNTCGSLNYPLLLSVLWNSSKNSYEVERHDPGVMAAGACTLPE